MRRASRCSHSIPAFGVRAAAVRWWSSVGRAGRSWAAAPTRCASAPGRWMPRPDREETAKEPGNRAVSKVTKTLDRILRGNADGNIRFGDLCALLHHLGFAERIRGDHHIFTREGVAEILNLQARGGKAKAYQVKQVRGVVLSYGL